jgi:hypothetical protein
VSGVFQSLLTRPIADKCRRIDVVKVKGSAQPMPLYCFDIFAGYLEELRPKLVRDLHIFIPFLLYTANSYAFVLVW